MQRPDSFDRAFSAVVAPGFLLAEPFDRSFAIACKLNQQWRHVTLWGPDALLVQHGLVREWDGTVVPAIDKVLAQFDMAGDISVDGPEARRCIRELKKKLVTFWENAKPIVEAGLQNAQENSIRYMKESQAAVAKQVTQAQWTGYLRQVQMDHIDEYMKMHQLAEVPRELDRLVKITEQKEGLRDIDRAVLADRLERFKDLQEGKLEGLADVEVGKAWNHSGVAYMAQEGVTAYQVVSEGDDRVCDVCLKLSGTVFSVDDAVDRMNKEIGGQEWLFPRFEQLSGRSAADISKSGALYPPFHGKCR